MDRIELGKTGLEVSRLGAGLSQIGLHMDESEMDQAGLRSMRSWTTESTSSTRRRATG